MEFFEFIFDFFTDVNVYIAGVIVYLFPKFLRKVAGDAWGAGKKVVKKRK